MKTIDRKKLIVSLIKDDLINSKLINGLSDLGLDSGSYHLHLGDTVFNLMGFKEGEESDKIYERYLELTKKAMLIDISEPGRALDDLALQIYYEISAKN